LSDVDGHGPCARFAGVAAELAVGTLSGSERGAAVAHLAACPGCRQLAVELTGVADDLLLVAPEVEPPPGFESRVLARLAADRAPRRSRLRTLVAVAAAAVLVAAGGGAVARGGFALGGGHHQGPAALRTALATSPGSPTTCRVVLAGGKPATLLISLDGPGGPGDPAEGAGDYVAEARSISGKVIPLGRFSLTGGHGLLATTVAVDATDVKSVRVSDADGSRVYEAFPAPTPA
jgi:hypothetical protein